MWLFVILAVFFVWVFSPKGSRSRDLSAGCLKLVIVLGVLLSLFMVVVVNLPA